MASEAAALQAQLDAAAVRYPILAQASLSDILSLRDFITQRGNVATPDRMAPAISLGFLFFWAACKLLRAYVFPFFLGKAQWRKHSSEHQRTMVIYVMQAIITTIALILQLTAVNFYTMHLTVTGAKHLFIAANLVLILYITELLYREQMRVQMNAHHLLTVTVLVFSVIMLYQTEDPSFAITGQTWLFQATTEQLTFVGLLGYRLKWRPSIVQSCLIFSAIQSLACKLASLGAGIYIWHKYQLPNDSYEGLGKAWSAIFWIVSLGLLATQIYGSYVVLVVARGYKKRFAEFVGAGNIVGGDDIEKAAAATRECSPSTTSSSASSTHAIQMMPAMPFQTHAQSSSDKQSQNKSRYAIFSPSPALRLPATSSDLEKQSSEEAFYDPKA